MKRFLMFAILVLPTILMLSVPALEAQDGDHAFVGAAKCKKCHLKQFKSWAETPMAMAFDNLKPGEKTAEKEALGLDPASDYTADADCFTCHATGVGHAGGFTATADTPDLASVGCENCHGAGGTYIQDGYMTLKNKQYVKTEIVAVGMVDTVGEAQCGACHRIGGEELDEGKPHARKAFDFESQGADGLHESFGLKYEH